MLIFGGRCKDWRNKAVYAEDDADNELAEVREIRCVAIDDVPLAMTAMAVFAANSNCEKFLYHAHINLYPGERLLPEQWREIVDRLEDELKLTGHHRIVFEHIKKNRQHYHIYWLRIPPEGRGPAATLYYDYTAHKKVALWAEKAFVLKAAPRTKQYKKSFKPTEDGVEASAAVIHIYKDSQTTKDFIEGLSRAGFELAVGRKDCLLIVARNGHYQTLLRWLGGVRKADLYKKFPDLGSMQFRPLSLVLSERRPKSKNRMINRSFRRAGRTYTKLCHRRRRYKSHIRNMHWSQDMPRVRRHAPRLKINYAGMFGEDETRSYRKKGEGKGDGAGGGAASIASALKSSPEHIPSIKRDSGDDIGKGNGPERRKKNMWVAVERRQQTPK